MRKGIYILFLVLLSGIVASKTYMPTNIMIRSIPNGTNTSFSINGSPACTPGNGLCNVTNQTLGLFGNNTYIKKDGTTTTTARIPFDLGIETGSITNGADITMQPDAVTGKPALTTFVGGGNRNDGIGGLLFLQGGYGLANNGIVCVGATCTSSHSLLDIDDLMIDGNLEVNGNSYFDDNIALTTNKGIYFRSANYYILSPSANNLDIVTDGGTIQLGGSSEVLITNSATLGNAVTPVRQAYVEELYASGYSEFNDQVDFTQGPVSISGGGTLAVAGLSTFNGGILLPDNDKANFGTGNDFHISFDGDEKLWINSSSPNSQIRVASNMVVQQKKNITLLNNTNLNLQAKYSGGGFPSYKRYDASEINWLIGNDNQESGNTKFVSLYADEVATTNRGYNIVSQQGIYLSANSGAGAISLNGKVNFADGLQLGFGTGVGGNPDFYQYYGATGGSMIFESNNGIGFLANGWIFNEVGRDRDFRIESDNDADMFVINGSVDKLGIGTSNPNEKLTIVGGLNQSRGNATINLIYANFFLHNDSGTGFNVASSGVYYNASLNNVSVANGVYMNAPNISVNYKGVYNINIHGAGSGVANHNYHLTLCLNGKPQYNFESHLRISSPTDVGSMASSGQIYLDVDDIVTLCLEDETGTGEATIYSLGISLMRVGN